MSGPRRLERALGIPVLLTLARHDPTRDVAVWTGADLVVRVEHAAGTEYRFEITARGHERWSGSIRLVQRIRGVAGLRRALRQLLYAPRMMSALPRGAPPMRLDPKK